MEGSRRTWLDPDKEENFFKKYFWLSGRIGRGAFGFRMMWIWLICQIIVGLFILWISFQARNIGIIGAADEPSTIFVGNSLFSGYRTILLVSTGIILISIFSLALRRFCDKGKPVKIFIFIMICFIMLLVSGLLRPRDGWLTLVSFCKNLMIYYLLFWPGEVNPNQYGEPSRSKTKIAETSWEQLKREFFSMSGRIGRKWFFAMMMAATFLYWSQLDTSELLRSSPAMRGMNLLVGIIAWRMLMSLIRRRLQDIGWSSRWLFFIAPLVLIGIYFVSDIWKIGGETILIGFALWLLGVLILSLIPGQEGSNEHGRNPVEADLLPGEVAD